MDMEDIVDIVEGSIPVMIDPTASKIKIAGNMNLPSDDSPGLTIETRDW